MKMNPADWQQVQDHWEADPRTGYAWIVREMDLPVSAPAVRKRALKESWAKVTTTEAPAKLSNPDEFFIDRRPDLPEQVYRAALLGPTQAETATLVGVSERTFRNWLKDRKEIADAWFRGGAYADAQVARALYKRATGAVTSDHHVAVIDNQVTVTPLEKHYPPDVAAARLWLKNRQPQLWRDKVELEQPPTIALVDKEKMDAMYERVLEQAAETQARMAGRAERLGLMMDSERMSYESD